MKTMKPTPRKHAPDQKVAIWREQLIDQKPVSEVCRVYQLHPKVFYRWQKEFFVTVHSLSTFCCASPNTRGYQADSESVNLWGSIRLTKQAERDGRVGHVEPGSSEGGGSSYQKAWIAWWMKSNAERPCNPQVAMIVHSRSLA